ncbi:hypothetical protein H9Q70_008968 [Fusarium xylarioides]|nr:hypothetical protein H9Q70_008968 [Fusarium xylarioides]KAG5782247.1 hypothetical protein H9Q73_004116 [Fusarium xylarioides]
MPKKIELVLEGQEGHEQDIISYLDSELEIGDSKLAQEVRAQIKEKASGVFMWVVLVSGILQQKYDQGRIHTLKQTLREIPGDLHELFRDILTRDNANKDELLLCIQWILFARKPLKPEQLYFAIRSHTERATSNWDRDEIGEVAISNFILSSSKGLAEVTRVKKDPTVQFIHESVRDFLLKDDGLRVVLMERDGNIGAESHDQLKDCCFGYMQSYLTEHGVPAHDSKRHLMQARSTADSEFPFLRYAVQNVLYHANAAEEGNVSQASFLETFPYERWILYNNIFQDKGIRRHTCEASLLYVLAECNYASLIQGYHGSQSCFDIEGERYGAPIVAAMATGSRPAVLRLLQRETRDEPETSRLRDLCNEYRVELEKKPGLGRDFKYKPKWSLLYYVLQDQDLTVASFAIASPRAYTNTSFRTSSGETAFSVAAQQDYDFFAAVKLLVDSGADIEISDHFKLTPLCLAAQKGNAAAVAFLLINNANVNHDIERGYTPIVYATFAGNEECMEQLISAGADLAVVDYRGQTLLFRAADSSSACGAKIRLLIARNLDVQAVDNNGYTALTWSLIQETATRESARILLNHEDTIDRTDSMGRTILSRAAEYSNYRGLDFPTPDFIRLLLDRGADVNRADNSDRAPLSYAAFRSDPQAADCVRLLLERGADPNIVDKIMKCRVRSYCPRKSCTDIDLCLTIFLEVQAGNQTTIMRATDSLRDTIRDAPLGQILRFVTSNRLLKYPEELSEFELPAAWTHVLNTSDLRTACHHGTDTPLTIVNPTPDENTIQDLDLESKSLGNDGPTDTAPNVTENGVILVDWYSGQDPENPQNWSNLRRALIGLIICFYTFVVYLSSAIYSPSVEGVMEKFGVSNLEATLGLAMYVLGYGIGPLLFSPLGEIPRIGRNPVYIITFGIFVIISIPTALVDLFAGLIVLRFLQGFFGSPCLASGGASLGDMYGMIHMPLAMIAWVGAMSCGPSLGPLISAYAVTAKGWRWSLYESIWVSAPVLIALFIFMPETSAPNILLRRAERLRRFAGSQRLQSQSEIDQAHLTVSGIAVEALIKPLEITIKDPAVLFVQIYSAILYAIYYSYFEVFPLVFPVYYDMTLGEVGLVFICIAVGCILDINLYGLYLYYVLIPRMKKSGIVEQEEVLSPGLAACFGPTIGLFIFAWTARASIH